MRALLGIWTPQAAILCYACHGPTVYGKPIADYDKYCTDLHDAPHPQDEAIAPCDKCKRPIILSVGVAGYANLRDRLNALGGIDAKLEQTGGMCAAMSAQRAGKPASPILFVTGLEDGVTYYLGLYATEDDIYEGNPVGDIPECATEDEAVQAIRAALLGGA